jgi:ATP-dependent RNA helicase DeaD
VRLSAPLVRALGEMGYEAPTPIQQQIIQPMLDGKDVVAQAQTGTGKTAGFGIPIAELVDGQQSHVQAVVLVPTRELAVQVTEELHRISKYRGLRVTAVYGGKPIKGQIDELARGTQVVVGTPGRVIDHLERRTLRIDRVRLAVIDEADQMLDIGFFPDIRRILRSTPKQRQTALFGATMPMAIRRLIGSYFNDPLLVRVGSEEEVPVSKVRQMYCEVASRDKQEVLLELLDSWGAGQTLIFRRTQMGIDRLVPALKRRGHSVRGIHGGMKQQERDEAMQAFRSGELRILIATNVASRGIDIPTMERVVNYDIPENMEEYIHRIGRTARIGRSGMAMTFVAEWDLEIFDAIVERVGAENLQHYETPIYKPANR